MTQDTNVQNLIINKLTKAQYEGIATPSDTELYLTPDTSLSAEDLKTINNTSLVGSGNISVQAVISDLSTIRSGASAGATALQPNDNISELTNNVGYITGITSSDVTTALGYTPYNSTNPNGYITASALNGYATESFVTSQGYITNSALTGYATENWVTNQNYVNGTTLANTLADYVLSSDLSTTLANYVTNSSLTNTLVNYALTSTLAEVATSGDYDDLINKPTIPSAVTESTVSGWGFTKNTGTITGITMNGSSKGTSGVVDLGTVITDVSNKQDTLVSGTNIKTINSTSLLGSGNVAVQETLVSGTNIKTINNNSILGSGNLTLDGLPDQTNKAGYLLTTDGTDASWGETAEVYPVIETYVNGTSWYRVYSDGWCEQGGYVFGNIYNGGNGVICNFLKTFGSTNYQVNITMVFPTSSNVAVNAQPFIKSQTASAVTICNYQSNSVMSGYYWEAKGYIEV